MFHWPKQNSTWRGEIYKTLILEFAIHWGSLVEQRTTITQLVIERPKNLEFCPGAWQSKTDPLNDTTEVANGVSMNNIRIKPFLC